MLLGADRFFRAVAAAAEIGGGGGDVAVGDLSSVEFDVEVAFLASVCVAFE